MPTKSGIPYNLNGEVDSIVSLVKILYESNYNDIFCQCKLWAIFFVLNLINWGDCDAIYIMLVLLTVKHFHLYGTYLKIRKLWIELQSSSSFPTTLDAMWCRKQRVYHMKITPDLFNVMGFRPKENHCNIVTRVMPRHTHPKYFHRLQSLVIVIQTSRQNMNQKSLAITHSCTCDLSQISTIEDVCVVEAKRLWNSMVKDDHNLFLKVLSLSFS